MSVPDYLGLGVGKAGRLGGWKFLDGITCPNVLNTIRAL